MKVQTTLAMSGLKQKVYVPPVPLIPVEKKEIKKGEFLKLDLRSVPTDAESETYSFNFPFFKQGTPAEWIQWRKNYQKVQVGQNLTTGPSKYAMARQLLEGNALRVFNTSATTHGNETNEHFTAVLEDVTVHVFPRRALSKQKRYMRRHLRKPCELNIRQFVSSVQDMNADLVFFPGATPASILPKDELVEIVETLCPNSWQRQLLLQGFDVTEHTLTNLVEFYDRLQTVEEIYDDNIKKSSDKNGTKSKTNSSSGKTGTKWSAKSNKNAGNNKSTEGGNKRKQKWCPLHEVYGHDEHDCKVIQAQIKNMKDSWKAGTKKTHERVTQRRKDQEEFNAFKKYKAHYAKKGNKTKRRKVTFTEPDSCSEDNEDYNVFEQFKEFRDCHTSLSDLDISGSDSDSK